LTSLDADVLSESPKILRNPSCCGAIGVGIWRLCRSCSQYNTAGRGSYFI